MEEKWMQLAIQLARQGAGRAAPNPLVGAVLVKDGRLIGTGYHAQYGQAHAERNAIQSAQASPAGATLYVTLEPCGHQGKQPPCTEAIIESGIQKVVVGSSDPNPQVSGRGIRQLRAAGIEVETGFLQAACDQLNPDFFKFIQSGRPYVALKYAMTLDGKLSVQPGRPSPISGPEARRHAHQLRNRYAAILVGIGTVLADDPGLTCRIPGGQDPIRLVLDSRLRTSLDSQLVQTARQVRTILVCAGEGQQDQSPSPDSSLPASLAEKGRTLQAAGVEIWPLPAAARGEIDLNALLDRLGQEGLSSLLVEGGSRVHGSFLSQGLADRVYAYITPALVGGREAPSPIAGPGVGAMSQASRLSQVHTRQLGADLLMEGCLCSPD